MLKTYLLFFIGTFAFTVTYAQETEQKKNRLTDSVYEVYHVPKGNKYVKEGLYQALYQKKMVVATGMFEKNVKAGIWRFFDSKGRATQIYNYTAKKLIYEAPEDTTSDLRYFVDKELKPTDVVTKPIKTGGRYYGYLNYLRLFTLPDAYAWHEEVMNNLVATSVEMLISPGGRLADLKVHINNGVQDNIIRMNINFPDEEDKTFIPATLNGEAIASRILIRVYITPNRHLDFF